MKKLFIICGMAFSIWISSSINANEGKLGVAIGKVQVSTDGKTWTQAKSGLTLTSNMSIQTGYGSKAILLIAGGSKIEIGPSSMVKLASLKQGKYGTATDVDLQLGSLKANIAKRNDGGKNHFRVKTPTSVAGVRGTEKEISFNPDFGTNIKLTESSADIINQFGQQQNVPQGSQAGVGQDGEIIPPDEFANMQEMIFLGDPSQSDSEMDGMFENNDFLPPGGMADAQDFFNFIQNMIQELTKITFEKF